MWRSATNSKSGVGKVSVHTSAPVIENMAPLSAFHRGVVDKRLQDGSGAASNLDKQHPSALYLLANGSGASAQARSTAAQQASEEWSRLGGPTSVLALEPLLPVGESVAQKAELSARFSTWWDKQDLQMLQSLLQDPLRVDQQANPAAPTNMDLCEPLPGQLQTQLLWDVSKLPMAASSDATAATAAAAELAIDALLAAGVDNAAGMGIPAPAATQQAQHISPFAMPAPVNAARCHADPAELHLPAVLAPEDVGLPAAFLSPFAGPCSAQPQPLHAPDLLPGYKLPAPITAGSRGPSPTSSAAFDHAPSMAALAPSLPHVGADAARLQDQRARIQAHAGAAASAGLGAMQGFSTSPEAALLQDWQAGALPAGQEYAGTPAGSPLAENGVSTAAAAAPDVQHVSPFVMASPCGLDAACAGQRAPSAADMAIALEAAEAAAAAAALAQGAWPMDVLDTGLPPQGVRQGRVRKGLGGAPGSGRRVHSSTKTRLQIRELEEKYEAVLTRYKAELALNNILQQRWKEVSDGYDGVLVQRLQRAGTPPPSFLAAAAAAAAAASAHAANSTTAAAAAAAVPLSVHDSGRLDTLAAVVQTSWVDQLAQLIELLPLLESSSAAGKGPSAEVSQHTACAAATAARSAPTPAPTPATGMEGVVQGTSGAADEPSPFETAAGAETAAAGAKTTAGAETGAGAVVASAAAAGGSAAQANPPALQQNAEAAALAALSLPLESFHMAAAADLSDDDDASSPLTSPTESSKSQASLSSSSSQGVKRRRSATAAGNLCADLSLLLSSNLSLTMQPPCAKHARIDGNRSLMLTESDLRLLFSGLPSGPYPGGLLQQQQSKLQQAGQGGVLAESGSVAAAQLSAGALYDSLWGMFEQVGLAGPSMMYRCFGPRFAYCPCCNRSQSPCSMMALLLDDDAGQGGGGTCLECIMGGVAEADTGVTTAGAAGTARTAAAVGGIAPSGVSGLPAQPMYATPAHWQRVRECLGLTPEQELRMLQLWTGLQNAHAPFAARRAELVQSLQQQFWVTNGFAGIAFYDTCFAGEGVAAATDGLLAELGSSMAADYGIFLETCRMLWGDESPLTLVQKVKCLVACYPFWPDYSLLECLAHGSGSNINGAANTAAVAGARV